MHIFFILFWFFFLILNYTIKFHNFSHTYMSVTLRHIMPPEKKKFILIL